MTTAYETLREAQDLGIDIAANDGNLHVKAPAGVMTLELKRALKQHKADILYILALPEPAKPGAELEQLRREIGRMLREQREQEAQRMEVLHG
jgi:TubC N-terminal docking domain